MRLSIFDRYIGSVMLKATAMTLVVLVILLVFSIMSWTIVFFQVNNFFLADESSMRSTAYCASACATTAVTLVFLPISP